MPARYAGVTTLINGLNDKGLTFDIQHPCVIINNTTIRCPVIGTSGIYTFLKEGVVYLQVQGVQEALRKI